MDYLEKYRKYKKLYQSQSGGTFGSDEGGFQWVGNRGRPITREMLVRFFDNHHDLGVVDIDRFMLKYAYLSSSDLNQLLRERCGEGPLDMGRDRGRPITREMLVRFFDRNTNALQNQGDHDIDGIMDLHDRDPRYQLNLLLRERYGEGPLDMDDAEDGSEDDENETKTCFDAYMHTDEDISEFLLEDNENFVVKSPTGTYACQNLGNIRKQSHQARSEQRFGTFIHVVPEHYMEWYKCIELSKSYVQPEENIIREEEQRIIRISDQGNYMVYKPDWFWDGPIPGSRIFELIQDGQVPGLVTTSIQDHRKDATSGDHCNNKAPVPLYRLTPYAL